MLWPELSLYRFLFVLLQYQRHFPALASLLTHSPHPTVPPPMASKCAGSALTHRSSRAVAALLFTALSAALCVVMPSLSRAGTPLIA